MYTLEIIISDNKRVIHDGIGKFETNMYDSGLIKLTLYAAGAPEIVAEYNWKKIIGFKVTEEKWIKNTQLQS